MSRERVRVCPAPRCGAPIRPPSLMCKRHWFKVAKETRDRVWRGYRSDPGGPDHMAAIVDALREVQPVREDR